MAFDDLFRISSHAVIINDNGQVLQLKSTYGDNSWGLPGGALDQQETIHQALLRECQEELGLEVKILYLSGIYYHKHFNSHACIFRCELPEQGDIVLSDEHSDYAYFDFEDLSLVQQQRIQDCLEFKGVAMSASF